MRFPLLLTLPLAIAGFAADHGAGSGLLPPQGGDQAAGPAHVWIKDHEPWVATARVGDFMVLRRDKGRLVRQEVTRIGPDTITVAFSDAKTAKAMGEVQYRRQAGKPSQPAGLPEPEVAKQSSTTLTMHGQEIRCDVYRGIRCESSISDGTRTFQRWGAVEIHRSPDVPFDGVIKRMNAVPRPDPFRVVDGRMVGGGTGDRQMNLNREMRLDFEVVEFGFGKVATEPAR